MMTTSTGFVGILMGAILTGQRRGKDWEEVLDEWEREKKKGCAIKTVSLK
jgi:hypothetical protein